VSNLLAADESKCERSGWGDKLEGSEEGGWKARIFSLNIAWFIADSAGLVGKLG